MSLRLSQLFVLCIYKQFMCTKSLGNVLINFLMRQQHSIGNKDKLTFFTAIFCWLWWLIHKASDSRVWCPGFKPPLSQRSVLWPMQMRKQSYKQTKASVQHIDSGYQWFTLETAVRQIYTNLRVKMVVVATSGVLSIVKYSRKTVMPTAKD